MKKATFMEKAEKISIHQESRKNVIRTTKTEERRKISKLKRSYYDPDFDYEAFYD